MPPAFFIGGALLVLWAQGWRFDLTERELIATGVVAVTTVPPGATVLIDDVPRGTSPEVFLGIPVGATNICLEQSEYRSFCQQITLDAVLSYRFHDVHLVPDVAVPRPLGNHAEVLLDPYGRGFVRWYPELQDALVFDGDEVRFLDNITPVSDQAITRDGSLRSLTAPPRQVFASLVLRNLNGRFAVDGEGYLYFSGNGLFYKHTASLESSLLQRFDESIVDAFFLPESDSFVVVTTTGIFLAPRVGVNAEFLFEKDAGSTIHYYAAAEAIVWMFGEQYYWYSFGQERLI